MTTAGQRTWSSTRNLIFKQKIPESTTFPTGIRCSNSSTPHLGRIRGTNTEISIITPEIWGIIGTSGASFPCALLPEHSMPGKAPQLQPWELSSTATASFSSNFSLALRHKDVTPKAEQVLGAAGILCRFKQRQCCHIPGLQLDAHH